MSAAEATRDGVEERVVGGGRCITRGNGEEGSDPAGWRAITKVWAETAASIVLPVCEV